MNVTEAEWLTSPDPGPMIEFLRGKASNRKMRLFAIAAWRQSVTDPEKHRRYFNPEHLMPRFRGNYDCEPWGVWANERTHAAVEVAERFYDGRATEAELRDAAQLLLEVSEGMPSDAECAAADDPPERAPVREAVHTAEEAVNQLESIYGDRFDYDELDFRGGFAGRFAADVIEAVRRASEAAAPFAKLHEPAAVARDAAERSAACAAEFEAAVRLGQKWQDKEKQLWDHFSATLAVCWDLRGAAKVLDREREATAQERLLLERLYAGGAARLARDVIDRDPWSMDSEKYPDYVGPISWGGIPVPDQDTGWHAAGEAVRLLSGEQAAALLRCVFGNPYRPAVADPAWVTSTVAALCREIYESRDFAVLPILADAIQEAGCEDAAVLDHCRGPGPHVRGCWLLDLVLERG